MKKTTPTPGELLESVESAPAGIERLVQLLAVLRGPGGCPWDQDQTHQSLLPYLLEEAYEAADAIDRGDIPDTIEELGDLLLQIVFHAQLGRERGAFDLNDIAQREAEKMIERHPHVFASESAQTAGDVREQWEARKRRQKPRQSLGEGVPAALPALTRAHTITARASGLGFDWLNAEEVLPKIHEELEEVETAFRDEETNDGLAKLEEELGDLIFAAVNFARKAGIDPEAALRKATSKFVRRFDAMEKREQSRMDDADARKAWDRAWIKAKDTVG